MLPVVSEPVARLEPQLLKVPVERPRVMALVLALKALEERPLELVSMIVRKALEMPPLVRVSVLAAVSVPRRVAARRSLRPAESQGQAHR